MSSAATHIPAWKIARGIRDRQFSCGEVVDAHFRLIRRLDPRLNAFVCVDEERATRAAKQADEAVASRKPLGPLHGVPITIKSSIDVAGLRCETGSRLRQGHTAASDSPVVSRLKSAGAIVLGNTNVPEFLMAWETRNPLYGTTNSPWDLERTPGGSSGGKLPQSRRAAPLGESEAMVAGPFACPHTFRGYAD